MIYNKRVKLLVFVFLFLLLVPSLMALGLGGQKLSPLIYEPGKKIINPYELSDTNIESYLNTK